jgi:2-dehydro-3-deoxygalactonokinase
MWGADYIAVDWGTTNRRAWLVRRSGDVVADFADSMGLKSVSPGGFETAAAEIRVRLGDHPMMLAGMVGSDKGWRQAPYVPCPADAKSLSENILWIDARTGIIPGVSQIVGHADVMRGEEVQAIGAVEEGLVSPEVLICHPGTHAKWIRMRNGTIDDFQTMMTGELFSLLQQHSILAGQIAGDVSGGKSFEAGVEASASGTSLVSELFHIRARYLLDQDPPADASFASGLLIGSDVRAGLSSARDGEKIVVIGRTDLCRLYAHAIGIAGFESEIIDGRPSFLAGIRSIINRLQTG